MGGNIFDSTTPIKKEYIEPTVNEFKKRLNEVFPKIDFDFKFIGSTGKKEVSNDIDLALSESTVFTENNKVKPQDWGIDPNQLALLYHKIRIRARTSTIKQSKLRAVLKAIALKLNAADIATSDKNSGSGSLFFCFPQFNEKGEDTGETVQIDINFGNIDWLLFSYHSEAYTGNVKGLHRTQLLVALFAYKGRTFRHGSGIYNAETGKYEATTPEEAVELLKKLYGINFSMEVLNNFYSIMELLRYNADRKLPLGNQEKIIDIYLKILDSTRADIPEMFQRYWKENQLVLGLTGKFLPENSKLYKYLHEENLCEHCHKEIGSYCINPYRQDIDGEEIWEYICSNCYESLMGDI